MKNKLHFFWAILLPVFFIAGCTKDDDDNNNNNNNDPCGGKPSYTLKRLGTGFLQTDVSKDQVNMLFQVLDKNKKGKPGLTDVALYELLDYSKDMTESAEAKVRIDSFGAIPITVNTILLLDVSASVDGFVDEIKASALAFVNSSITQQRIAIYTFDGNTPKLRIDFTNNKTQLASAINSISETNLGTSTNLYEAVTTAAAKLPAEEYTTTKIVQGNILVFTDGEETASPQNKQQALNAVANRTVFAVALESNGLDETTLKQLAGTAENYFKANSISELETRFKEIQTDIQLLSRSVYWLYYTSPRKGANAWTVELKFRENCNTSGNYISASYYSTGF